MRSIKKMMVKGKACIAPLSLILFVMVLFGDGVARSKTLSRLPGSGIVLPLFSLPVPVHKVEKVYLNIGFGDDFQPGRLPVKVVLIEILSVYCAACQFQAPLMNELYSKVESDTELRNGVKMIGIGAGNERWEIDYYRDLYRFPLFPDADFNIHNLLGAPATPFLIFTRPDGQGGLVVVSTHMGFIADSDTLLDMVRKAYRTDISKVKVAGESGRCQEDLIIPISEGELMKKVRQSLSALGEEPSSIQEISLSELGTVYVGTIGSGRKRVFARIVARRVPCIDCHNVYFVYSFDDEGNFMDFVPIYITKQYNRKWDADDARKIKSNIVGKSIVRRVYFNPKVDAITSATISSKVVFDSFNNTHLIYDRLVELGYAVIKKK